MTSAPLQDLLTQMDNALDQLLTIAEKLNSLSQGTFSPEELHTLQDNQNSIISSISSYDSALKEKFGPSYKQLNPEAWQSVENKLEHFQGLNQSFIMNLKVRQSITQCDIHEINKTKQALEEVRVTYGNTVKKTAPKKRPKRSPGINTLS